MPSALARFLALTMCALSAALAVSLVISEDRTSPAKTIYASDAEVRLASLFQPVFGSDHFRLAVSDPINPQLIVLVDANSYPEGTLPINQQAITNIAAEALSVPTDRLTARIRHIPFQRDDGAPSLLEIFQIGLSIALATLGVALVWTLTKLDKSPKLPIASGVDTRAPDSSPTPPEKAAQLIKGWMREVEPS